MAGRENEWVQRLNGNSVLCRSGKSLEIFYEDDGKEVDLDNPRPCPKCGNTPTKEGHDSCISNLPGVRNACCGHGVEEPYVQMVDGTVFRGKDAEFAIYVMKEEANSLA